MARDAIASKKYVRSGENRDEVGLELKHHSQGGGADSPPQLQDAGHGQKAGGVAPIEIFHFFLLKPSLMGFDLTLINLVSVVDFAQILV